MPDWLFPAVATVLSALFAGLIAWGVWTAQEYKVAHRKQREAERKRWTQALTMDEYRILKEKEDAENKT